MAVRLGGDRPWMWKTIVLTCEVLLLLLLLLFLHLRLRVGRRTFDGPF